MKPEMLLRQIKRLPPQSRQEVADFIGFLAARKGAQNSGGSEASKGSIADDPFVGLWKSRKEMKDGVKWVRRLRRREWQR